MFQSKSTWILILAVVAAASLSFGIYKHLKNNSLRQIIQEKKEVKSKPDNFESDLKLSEKKVKTEDVSVESEADNLQEDRAQPADEETIAHLNREISSLKKQLSQSQNLYSGGDKTLAARLDSLAAANNALNDSLYFLNEKYQKLRLNRNLYTLTNAKGDKIYYFGDMKGDRADGYGVAIWPSGEIYKGEWKNSKRHGKGILNWENGEKYVGDFADDKRNGYGIHNRADGARYEGEWKNDLEHGTGTLYDKGNKAVKQGNWKDGNFGG